MFAAVSKKHVSGCVKQVETFQIQWAFSHYCALAGCRLQAFTGQRESLRNHQGYQGRRCKSNISPCLPNGVNLLANLKQPEAVNCSCTWSKDAVTERALLCVAGRDAKVKVYNIKEGKLYKVRDDTLRSAFRWLTHVHLDARWSWRRKLLFSLNVPPEVGSLADTRL